MTAETGKKGKITAKTFFLCTLTIEGSSILRQTL